MTQNDEGGNRNGSKDQQGIYLGNKVHVILKFSYVAFALWAVFYLIRYLLPDLKAWLR